MLDANLDEHGVALLENLSLARPFQPVVTIEHAGASYEAVGEPMTPAEPTQKIEVSVYETTDQRPELKVQMRHVVAKATDEGLRVMDYLIVNNPGDRTWTGTVGADGKPAAMWVPLPAGVKDIEMDGAFHSCCAVLKDGKLVSTAPLMPGQSQFRIAYLVPGEGGKVSMTIEAPAPVGGMMLMVPEDQAGFANVEGLEKGQAFPANGGTTMRAFMGRDIMPGQKVTLTMTGLPVLAEGLCVEIDGRHILDKISLNVPAGQAVALMGANGAGKSTLLRVLATLTAPSEGELRLFGRRIGPAAAAVRSRIGIISHQPMLYRDLSIRENLEFFSRLYDTPSPRARATEMLALVGLTSRSGDAVKTLSRGMVQRAAIARAMMHDPALLLADEPFEGLDAPSARSLETLLNRLRADGRTLIMANHDVARSLALTDKAVLLRRGRLVLDRPSAALTGQEVLEEIART